MDDLRKSIAAARAKREYDKIISRTRSKGPEVSWKTGARPFKKRGPGSSGQKRGDHSHAKTPFFRHRGVA